MNKKLWYNSPAKNWNEALPLGNGRIGACVFSGTISDRFQLNEESLWSGRPNMHNKKHAIKEIEPIRALIKERKYADAFEKASEFMFGVRSQCYLTYGSFYVDILNAEGKVENYRRELDISTAVLHTEYELDGNKIEKECFVSLCDDVLVLNVKCEKPLDFKIYEDIKLEHKIHDDLIAEGRCPTFASIDNRVIEYDDNESIHFSSAIKPISKTEPKFNSGTCTLKSTTEFTLLFSIKTSFNGYDKMPVSEGKEYKTATVNAIIDAKKFSFDELKRRHIEVYKSYFDRVELELCGEDFSFLPTDERIKRVANGGSDNGLTTLLFDYSRYLTISSSLEGTQPSNLQGIWNDELIAAWHSNYTININTQMNYWPTETVNLPECHKPLMVMLKELFSKGNVFNLRGWSAWHNTDIWRFNCEATNKPANGFWVMGGAWLARHIWEHYLHTRDLDFLKEYYPVMLGACEFLEDWLIENERGELTTSPSTSPENQFVFEEKRSPLCEGSAMDISIVYDILDKTIKSGELLGEDVTAQKGVLARLAPVKIGSDGRILEWGEDFKENEPGHRHISQLYGFYPADILKGKKWEAAVLKTLETRLQNGGGHTGWSNAWIAVVYARLKNGEKVLEHIENMFANSIYPNMLDAHPPFQIDGNFGICAAICEALVHSHNDKIELLPALPKAWANGKVKGFITRTGEKVDFSWQNGKLTESKIYK